MTMKQLISSTLRNAIITSGKSANALGKAAGVPQSTIARFLAGADMKLSTASKLAEHLGLQLEPSITLVSVEVIPAKKSSPQTLRVHVIDEQTTKRTKSRKP